MTIKPFLVDGNLVVNEATITNSGTSIVLPSNSHFSGGGNIFNIASNTTDDITQGTTNLYFTNTKADARADLRISAASITALSDADQTVQTTDNVTFNNITSTGYLAGPASFTIDPAAVGDNTGTVVIAGNLTVNGTTTTVNSNTVNIGDNIIVLNSDETGTPSQNAGIEIERGTSTNVSLRFNETTDKWQFTNDGTTYNDLGTSDIVNDTTPQLGGTLDVNGNDIDLNGNELILDVDGDTTIKGGGVAGVDDDEIHVKVGGTDRVQFDTVFIRPMTDLGYSLGSSQHRFNNLNTYWAFISYKLELLNNAPIVFEGATDDAFETTLNVIDPTADRTINLPDATGTVALTSDIPSLSGYLQNVVEDTTPQLGGDLDAQAFNITTTGKILFANVYSQLADLPSASTYHGMFAHVHATGKAYFAHAGAWIELANASGVLADIVDDTSPQLGGDLDTYGKNINFGDSQTAGTDNTLQFGAGPDLRMYYDGSNSYIDHIGPDEQTLYIRNTTATTNTTDGIVLESNNHYVHLANNAAVRFGINGSDKVSVIANGSYFNHDVILNGNGYDLKWRNGNDYVTLTASVSGNSTANLPNFDGTIPLFTTAPTGAITDGSAGQVLQTDGAGGLSFVDQAGGGAVGGGTDKTFLETDNSVNSNYTLSTNRNAMTTGPVTINSGATITVPSGQRWIIL